MRDLILAHPATTEIDKLDEIHFWLKGALVWQEQAETHPEIDYRPSLRRYHEQAVFHAYLAMGEYRA
jgi:hypothetical protein